MYLLLFELIYTLTIDLYFLDSNVLLLLFLILNILLMKNNLGPLKGIVVLDLTRVLVGPYCTMVLSDLGARIIKVESPETGDDSRSFGPFIKDCSAYFMSLNRGKESIALNLKNKDDKKIFEKILAKSDVLVENFRPGTLDKWVTLGNY